MYGPPAEGALPMYGPFTEEPLPKEELPAEEASEDPIGRAECPIEKELPVGSGFPIPESPAESPPM